MAAELRFLEATDIISLTLPFEKGMKAVECSIKNCVFAENVEIV